MTGFIQRKEYNRRSESSLNMAEDQVQRATLGGCKVKKQGPHHQVLCSVVVV